MKLEFGSLKSVDALSTASGATILADLELVTTGKVEAERGRSGQKPSRSMVLKVNVRRRRSFECSDLAEPMGIDPAILTEPWQREFKADQGLTNTFHGTVLRVLNAKGFSSRDN